MASYLAIGGTGFIGAATVSRLAADGYDVTAISRSEPPEAIRERDVRHERVDRSDTAELRSLYESIEPTYVIDFAAFQPADVRAATDIFADVERYVYISSTHAYQYDAWVPLRERDTPLRECSPEQATDESFATYGPRKAEGDRIVFEAAGNGFPGIVVRPAAIFGPGDGTERQDYWIDRVRRYDEIAVPGDRCRMPTHLGYIEDVVDALELVIADGVVGEAYNVAHRRQLTFDELLEQIATALETPVTAVHVTEPELAAADLSPLQFSYGQPYPYVVSTEKIHALGLESTPYEAGVAEAVADHLESDRDGSRMDPGRDVETQLIATSSGARTEVEPAG